MVARNRFVPNTFVLGAAKCGTTAIHSFLSGLPEACMSNPKEPHFFECEFDRGLDFYRSTYFPHWEGEAVVGEARHRNLYLPYVPERIHAVNPRARLIASLRNPLERAYSHWWHWASRGLETATFDDAVVADLERIASDDRRWDHERIRSYCAALGRHGKGPYRTYVDSGHYAEQIERYFRLFRADQMLVIRFEELARSPEGVGRRLADFVGVELGCHAGISLEAENVSRVRISRGGEAALQKLRPWGGFLTPGVRRRVRRAVTRLAPERISETTRALLQRHYRPHNEALDQLLGWDISSRWR